jgi:parvulin-like peptidyl-prolyl isomerase
MDGKLRVPRASRLRGMAQRAGWFFSGMAVLAACMLFRWYAPAGSASAAKPPASNVKKASATEPAPTPAMANTAATAPKKNPIAAIVNNEPITRDELARECLTHYGAEVLESIVNRSLILAACQERKITITDKQVDDEIDRMARKFSLGKDQWLKTLEHNRGIKPARYAKDIVWPTLALRELAKSRLTVSKQEIDEAFASEFGPSVKVRLIAIETAEKARQIHGQAVAKPDEFPALAKKYSKDINSASAYGLIQPIRRHAGDPQLEKAAFSLKPGQVSNIVKVGELYVFVKCEEQMPPPKGVNRADVDPMLADALRDRKLRSAAGDVFKELQKTAVVQNILNDPVKSQQMPGVAATINQQTITIRELAEECIDRHGTDVIEGAVNRKLLDQAMRKKNLKLTDADLNDEIARAAISMGQTKPDGKPDVDAWLALVLKNENISREIYVHDEVWPSVALKKLVGNSVEITQEDLKRGYDANYGPKVQCRAIVVNNERRAQEVWEKARENPTVKNFGDLAEQYSIEAGSRSLRGEVPPIRKNGGQPLLEKEAFTLKPGELSGVVQVAGNYVILFCEGYTKPIKTTYEEVKDMLYRDIQEKKMRLAMAKTFDGLKDEARIDNFLTGNIKAPKREEQSTALDPSVKLPKVIPR